ncbi:MAG: hypothetical protein IRZ28_01710 [Steroidobacteraceae bacterium]|nr:hypothetical protein [Steroidobacteraceae bacterium]
MQLELECVDRMYLNAYVPQLQHDKGVVGFFRFHRGHTFASSALMKPISEDFVARLECFAKEQGIPLIRFEKGQRKDDVAQEYLARFKGREGLLFIGKAQEKTPVFRTERRRHPKSGQSYAWIVPSTGMVNHYNTLTHQFGSSGCPVEAYTGGHPTPGPRIAISSSAQLAQNTINLTP